MKTPKKLIEKLLDSRTLELENKIKELNLEIEERRRVEEVLSKQNCILALNENIASSYTNSDSLQNMLKKCVEAMVQHLDVVFARIWTLSKDGDMLELQASAGIYTHIDGFHSRIHLGNLKIGLIALERKPHLTNCIDDDPRINDKEWAKRERIVAFAGYPLITEDKLAGVIGMFSRRNLTNDILQTIASVAPEIALIIERKKSEELLKNINDSLEKLVHERTQELAEKNEELLLEIAVRKESEDELKQSKFCYQQLFEDSPIPLWVEDFTEINTYFDRLKEEGVHNFREYFDQNPDELKVYSKKIQILEVNKATLELYQAKYKEELLGSLDKTFTERSFEVFKNEIVAIAEGKNSFESEAETITLNGEIRYVYLRFYLSKTGDGNINYKRALVVTSDITEHKQIEEALLQSEKLKALGVMTTGIAHEFNNLLAIIKGYAQLLELKFAGSGEFIEGLRTIIKASDDGALLVRRMKEFIAIDGNAIWFESVDINDLIKQTINYLKPRWNVMARVSGVNYQIDLKGLKKVPFIKGCSSDLREILINIINNAFDAMPHGGILCFVTWSQNSKVFVSISDTGIGMSKEVKERIFDPFFTTRMPEGTGLGMSAVYGIIKKLNGEIHVESESGKGSTFTLGFPVATDISSKVTLPRPSLETNDENLRILVVDDENEICGFLQDFLSEKGYIVWSVNSGNEAIRLLKCKTFDLVLCDLIMPDGTGRDVIKVLNTLDKRPKVGLITGWSEKIDSSNDEKLKVDFVLKKPFDFSELSKQINKILNAASQSH